MMSKNKIKVIDRQLKEEEEDKEGKNYWEIERASIRAKSTYVKKIVTYFSLIRDLHSIFTCGKMEGKIYLLIFVCLCLTYNRCDHKNRCNHFELLAINFHWMSHRDTELASTTNVLILIFITLNLMIFIIVLSHEKCRCLQKMNFLVHCINNNNNFLSSMWRH